MSAVIDTNILIFDTFEDSEFHIDASSQLDKLARWYIPTMVFHELVWFFRSEDFSLTKANIKIEEYLTSEKSMCVPNTPDDIRFASSHIKNYGEYNDLVILSVARRLDLPLFTFDSDLKKIASKNQVRLLKQ